MKNDRSFLTYSINKTISPEGDFYISSTFFSSQLVMGYSIMYYQVKLTLIIMFVLVKWENSCYLVYLVWSSVMIFERTVRLLWIEYWQPWLNLTIKLAKGFRRNAIPRVITLPTRCWLTDRYQLQWFWHFLDRILFISIWDSYVGM